MTKEIMAGLYFMAQMSSSVETIVTLRARAPALFLTVTPEHHWWGIGFSHRK